MDALSSPPRRNSARVASGWISTLRVSAKPRSTPHGQAWSGWSTFKLQDALETDVSDATVVTLYMLSAINVKLRPILTRQLRPGARIVSHNFAMGDWEPEHVDTFKDAAGTTRTLYLWTADGKVRP